MSFGEHLEELRKRIMRALLGSVFGVGLCVVFMFQIYDAVARPYILVAGLHHANQALNTLKPQESFFTVLSLAVKAGLVLSSPWIIYQIWQFVGAGLYKRERKIIYRYIGPSAFLFLLGIAFFYFIVLPMTLNFFFTFSAQSGPSSPPKPNWLEKTLLQIPEETKPAPPATVTAAAGTGTTSAPETAPATQPQSLPVFATDPPAPPEGFAIIYYDSAKQCVKIRLHDRIQILPAAPQDQGTATEAQELAALDHDPPAPPEGKALIYYDTNEQRVKVRLHDQIQVPMVVAQGALIINTWRSDDYLNFVTFTALIFGLAFQLPMVILILAQIDIVPTQTFRNVRKYAYFGILIAAVAVAPSGDLMTLGFLFIPLVLLYEVGIVAAAIATRGRPKED